MLDTAEMIEIDMLELNPMVPARRVMDGMELIIVRLHAPRGSVVMVPGGLFRAIREVQHGGIEIGKTYTMGGWIEWAKEILNKADGIHNKDRDEEGMVVEVSYPDGRGFFIVRKDDLHRFMDTYNAANKKEVRVPWYRKSEIVGYDPDTGKPIRKVTDVNEIEADTGFHKEWR